MAGLCVVGVERWDRLQVRAGPGVRNRAIASIPAGACGISVTGPCRGDWCPVTWRGRQGWSHGDFLGRYDRPPTRAERGPVPVAPGRQPQRAEPKRQQVPAQAAMPRDDVAKGREQASQPAQVGTTLERKKTQVTIEPASTPSRQSDVLATGSITDAAKHASKQAGSAETGKAEPPRAAFAFARPDMSQTKKAAPPKEKPAVRANTAVSSLVVGSKTCVAGIGKDDTLKIRSGPGPAYALRYGYLPTTCGIEITGACTDGWCPVEYRGYKGWALGRYLKP